MKELLPTPEPYAQWFDITELKADIKQRSLKGGFFTILGQAAIFLVNFGSTMIMARLLTPEDFGVITMVTAVTGFVMMFKDMGLSSAIIQAPRLDQTRVSSLFWINLCLSTGLAVILLAIAPLIALFYEVPKLSKITSAYAIGVLVAGLSQQHSALLSRQMMFRKLSKVNILAVFFSVLVGIGAAWYGFKEWSIVMQHVSLAVFTTLGMWLSCNWRPAWVWNPSSVRNLLGFGAGISGFNLINYFSRNMDNILIGKYLGTNVLGLYSKAYQLLMLPITQLRDPLTTVGIPAMSSLAAEPARFRSYYLKYVYILAFFAMPIVGFMAVFAKPLILLFLGTGWEGAVQLFQLLAITAFIQPLMSTASLVLISTGQAKRYFYLGVVNSMLVVISFFIGILISIEGLIVGYAIMHYVTLIPLLMFSFRGTAIKLSDFFSQIALPCLFAVVAAAGTWLLIHQWSFYENSSPVVQLIVGSLVFGFIWLSGWLSHPYFRQKGWMIKDLVMELISKKKKTT